MNSESVNIELLAKVKDEELLRELESKLSEILENSKFGEVLKGYNALEGLQISIVNQSTSLNFALFMGCCYVKEVGRMVCPCPNSNLFQVEKCN
jgi:hypothetical protein